MKKNLTKLLVILIFVFALSANIIIKEKKEEILLPNETILVEKIYNNWDEAKHAGEYIVDEKVGLVKFRYASRIRDTEKFSVTYASVSNKKVDKN